MSDEIGKTEISLEDIHKSLDNAPQTNNENSELLKEAEEFVAKYDELIAKSDAMDAEIAKKREEWELGKEFADYIKKNIENMPYEQSKHSKQKLDEILRVSEEYNKLMSEHNAVLTELVSMKTKLEELINKN